VEHTVERRAQRADAVEHARAELGVRADLFELVRIEGAGLVENRPVELELADVVQRAARLDRLDARRAHVHGGSPAATRVR